MSEKKEAQKIWDKGVPVDRLIEGFTIGKDPEMDRFLAPWDVMGSMAHTIMLNKIGLIGDDELQPLLRELKLIYGQIERDEFRIEDGVEDIHS